MPLHPASQFHRVLHPHAFRALMAALALVVVAASCGHPVRGRLETTATDDPGDLPAGGDVDRVGDLADEILEEVSTFIERGTEASPLVLAAAPVASPWQNPIDRHDVNGDGQVTPLDVLIITNHVNAAGGSVELPVPAAGFSPPPYLDVNGDGWVTPLDALLIVNLLNGAGGTTSGNPSPDPGTPANPVGPGNPSGGATGAGPIGSWATVPAPATLKGRSRHVMFGTADHVAICGGVRQFGGRGATSATDCASFDVRRELWGKTAGSFRGIDAEAPALGMPVAWGGGYMSLETMLTWTYDGFPLGKLATPSAGNGVYQELPDARLKGRDRHTVVALGEDEVMVWGGRAAADYKGGCITPIAYTDFGDGAIYNRRTNSWRPVSGVNAPLARYWTKAAWSGSEVLFFGGTHILEQEHSGICDVALTVEKKRDAVLYNPATNSWRSVPRYNCPPAYDVSGRLEPPYRVVWINNKFVIFDRRSPGVFYTVDPHNPEFRREVIPIRGNARAPEQAKVFATQHHIILWGGDPRDPSGMIYRAAENAWYPMQTAGAEGRVGFQGVVFSTDESNPRAEVKLFIYGGHTIDTLDVPHGMLFRFSGG